MKSRLKRFLVLFLCVAPLTLWCCSIRDNFQGPIKLADFSTLYFGTRSAIHGADPYSRAAFVQELVRDHISFAGGAGVPKEELQYFIGCVYPPTTLAFMIPFALLPWATAQNLFMWLTASFTILAGLVAWDFGAKFASVLSGCLVCSLVSSCMLIELLGNPAGIVTGFCVVAAGCFLKKRYEAAGVFLLALSLVIKPHDAGFVWLYFLLTGGTGRKRALQTLMLAGVLVACASIWIAPLSPNWLQEARFNRAPTAAYGAFNDPGPSGPSYKTVFPDVSLEGLISIFRNDPRFYNPLAYLIGGGLILAWVIAVVRKRSTEEGALLALAAIAILTLLPLYHRTYDAKLLLLSVPACAILWAFKGPVRWIALSVTAAAVFVTSDAFLILLSHFTHGLAVSSSTWSGKLILMVLRPEPLVLLAAGCFYLWAYVHYESQRRPLEIAETEPAVVAIRDYNPATQFQE